MTGAPELVARASLLTDINRAADAIPLLHRAIGMAPDDRTAWCELARAELTCGEPRNALQAINQALACDPTDEWPHRVASMALSRLGDHDGAVNAAREAVRLAPHTWQTHVQLADAIDDHPQPAPVRQSLRNEAWAAANRAVELAPHESRPHSIVGHLALTNNASVQAEQAFREALRLDPSNARARNGLGLAGLKSGRMVAAAADFGAAAAINPQDSVARTNVLIAVWGATLKTSKFLLVLLIILVPMVYQSRLVIRLAVATVAVSLLGFACLRLGRRIPRLMHGYLRRLPRRQPLLGAALALMVATVLLLLAAMFPSVQSVRVRIADFGVWGVFLSLAVAWFGFWRFTHH